MLNSTSNKCRFRPTTLKDFTIACSQTLCFVFENRRACLYESVNRGGARSLCLRAHQIVNKLWKGQLSKGREVGCWHNVCILLKLVDHYNYIPINLSALQFQIILSPIHISSRRQSLLVWYKVPCTTFDVISFEVLLLTTLTPYTLENGLSSHTNDGIK